jgi:hypothetical protein
MNQKDQLLLFFLILQKKLCVNLTLIVYKIKYSYDKFKKL